MGKEIEKLEELLKDMKKFLIKTGQTPSPKELIEIKKSYENILNLIDFNYLLKLAEIDKIISRTNYKELKIIQSMLEKTFNKLKFESALNLPYSFLLTEKNIKVSYSYSNLLQTENYSFKINKNIDYHILSAECEFYYLIPHSEIKHLKSGIFIKPNHSKYDKYRIDLIKLPEILLDYIVNNK